MSQKISIIIPTFNGAKKLPKCLDSLLAQETERKYEILVVDDGSGDNTSEVVLNYGSVKLLTQKNSGPAVARNCGVKEAEGEIVLFIDDDCIAEPGWIDKMSAPFDDKEISAVKGAYLSEQTEIVARFVQIEYEEKYEELLKHDNIDFIDTYSAGFRRSVFLEAGGYDAKFSTASVEDQELSFRLAGEGRKMLFLPEARVTHTHVNCIFGYARKKFKIGYWKALLLIKNPKKSKGDSHTPLTLKLQIFLMGLFLPTLIVSVFIETYLPLLGFMALFILTAIPLTLRAVFRDFPVGIASPLIILVRAAALTAGLTKGFIDFLLLKRSNVEGN